MAKEYRPEGIDPSTRIHGEVVFRDTVTIGTGVTIGYGVTMGRDVTIGNDSVIGSYAVLQDDVVIGPRSVIGHDVYLCKGVSIPADSIIAADKAIFDAEDFGELSKATWPRTSDYWDVLHTIETTTDDIAAHADATLADREECRRLASLIQSDGAVGINGWSRMSVDNILETIETGIAFTSEACGRLRLAPPELKHFADMGESLRKIDAETLARSQFALAVAQGILDHIADFKGKIA